jgi:hypothetical protein
MKRTVVVVVAFLLIALWIFFSLERGEEEGGEAGVPVQEAFPTKIVYTTEVEADTAALEADCRERGGTFNECGSICAPDAGICAEVCAYTCENIPRGERGSDTAGERSGEAALAPGVDTGDWSERTLEDYGVTLKYPASDWSAAFDTSFALSPKLNVYVKPPGVPLDLPLDHFANVTHFSVYPRGIPTEGLFGPTRPLDFTPPFPVSEESHLFVLEDGTPFAAYIRPTPSPRGWNDSGFLWMRVRVEDLETRCMRDGREMSPAECDPMVEDDRILRTGSVDPEAWRTEKAMLSTVRLGTSGNESRAEQGGAPGKGDEAPGGEGSDATGMISLRQPRPSATVASPLTVSGEARGPWYFEGSFPVVLTDWDGLIIAETRAAAQEEWMAESFVPFRATLSFESPYGEGDPEYMRRGTLILHRANPSGRPENAGAMEIPVRFAGPEGLWEPLNLHPPSARRSP